MTPKTRRGKYAMSAKKPRITDLKRLRLSSRVISKIHDRSDRSDIRRHLYEAWKSLVEARKLMAIRQQKGRVG